MLTMDIGVFMLTMDIGVLTLTMEVYANCCYEGFTVTMDMNVLH